MSSPSTPAPKGPPIAIAVVALAVAVVLPLAVWTYAKDAPELWGIPFFFWYQFLLVFVSVACTTIAYQVVIRHERARRAAQGLDERGGDA